MPILQAGLGLLAFIAIAWLFSEHKRRFPWREVLAGLALQFAIAALLLGVPGAQRFFVWANQLVIALTDATRTGTAFVFGYLAGGDPPFVVEDPGNSFVLAFQALPLVLVLSALSALLFYWRILPWLIHGASRLLQRFFGIGGALGVGTASNIFLSMVESPLVIRPYLQRMNRSELFALMSVGMATLAGTMLVLYSTIIGTVLDDALGHLIVASLISLPAALLVATVMIPPTAPPTDGGSIDGEEGATSAMDAITRGTLRGMELLLQIVALLVVVVALVALVNTVLAALPPVAGAPLSLERALGWVFAPLAWLMGIPWAEAAAAGSLLGIKTVLNEMVAFMALAELEADALSARSELILIYALSGFANLGSLGILIGGLGALVPERRSEIVALGLRDRRRHPGHSHDRRGRRRGAPRLTADATVRETLTNVHARARVAFACEQGAVTAVQSLCTREPLRRSHARFGQQRAAEPRHSIACGVGTPGSPILRCAPNPSKTGG